MKCPNCGLENPPSASVCDCGHHLSKGEVSRIQVDSDVQVDIGKENKPKVGTAKEALLIFFGILAILFGAFWVVVTATFLGGPLVFAYLLSQNFRSPGHDGAAGNSLWTGVGYLVLLGVGLASILPERGGGGFSFLVILILMMVAGYLVQSYREFQIKRHLEEGGHKVSIGKTLLVVLTAYLLMALLGGLLYLAAESTGFLGNQGE